MKDIHNERDYRNIPIDKVGIKNLRYPITVLDRKNGYQQTVASINMYVDLPHKNKGTHMSRFVEILHLFRPEVSLKNISDVLAQMKKHQYGRDSAIIGEVKEENPGRVVMKTGLGTTRIIDMPVGEPLPRIC